MVKNKIFRLSIVLCAAVCSINCLKNIKYEVNPISGKNFTVNFQAEDVQARFGNGDLVGYVGSCEITSNSNRILTIVDLRNANDVSGNKASLDAGVVLAAGQKTKITWCFLHPKGNSIFQIVYKDGEKLLIEDYPVQIIP